MYWVMHILCTHTCTPLHLISQLSDRYTCTRTCSHVHVHVTCTRFKYLARMVMYMVLLSKALVHIVALHLHPGCTKDMWHMSWYTYMYMYRCLCSFFRMVSDMCSWARHLDPMLHTLLEDLVHPGVYNSGWTKSSSNVCSILSKCLA